jgi:hypothetical protein
MRLDVQRQVEPAPLRCKRVPDPRSGVDIRRDQWPIYVQVSPLAPVLGKGIVASDCEAHYETSDGRDYSLNWTATVNLKKDHVLFIPFGCVAHFVHADDLSDGEQRSNIGIDATCLAAPLFNKGWKDMLLPNIVEAIKSLHEPQFTSTAGSAMWSQRAESFRACM